MRSATASSFCASCSTSPAAALTDGALGDGATRTGPEIEEYLARAGAALDADADDTLQALSDGVLTVRYLFGFAGNVLVGGALDPDARRADPVAIDVVPRSLSQP